MPAAWKDSTLRFRRRLSIDNTPHGALTAFPCRVRLESVDPTHADSIQVWDSAQTTQHDHQVIATGTDWIELYFARDLSANTKETSYLYYGKRSATDASTIDVWDANFVLVMPFTEQSGQYQDYSGSSHHAATTQVTSRNNEGEWPGYAAYFDGADDYIDFGNVADLQPDAWTVEAYLAPDSDAEGAASLIRWSAGGATPGIYLSYGGERPLLYLSGTNYVYFDISFETEIRGTWHSVAYSITGALQNSVDDAQFYLDGVSIAQDTKVQTGAQDAKSNTAIGAEPITPVSVFKGHIAEVRISNAVRSADWIEATSMGFRNTLVTVHQLEATDEGWDSLAAVHAAAKTIREVG